MSQPVQMRYQQKQQLERDQRKSDMVNNNARARSSLRAIDMPATAAAAASSGGGGGGGQQHLLTASLGAGKVRQMFDERRQKTTTSVAGIDKSYPLQPIAVPPAAAAATGSSRRSPLIGAGAGGARTPAAARIPSDQHPNRTMPLSADASTMPQRRRTNNGGAGANGHDDNDDIDNRLDRGDHHHHSNATANSGGRYVLSSHITSADFLDNEQFPGMWNVVFNRYIYNSCLFVCYTFPLLVVQRGFVFGTVARRTCGPTKK